MKQAIDGIKAQINNRFSELRILNDKVIRLNGEIAGLREAQHQIDKATALCEKVAA